MRVHALSALSLVGLATTAAAQTTDEGSFACLSSIMALAEASPTVPAALAVATDDCVPSSLTAAASSFTSDAKVWYTSILDAVSACPAWPSASTIPALEAADIVACTGEQPSSAATAVATTTSASGTAVATSANTIKSSTNSVSAAASGTGSATTSARSSAASGSAGRSATTSSTQSANAAARETGVVFAAVAMAALGAAAL